MAYERAKVEADEAGVFQGWDQRCFFQDRADDGYANSWDADATASAPVELIELWQDGVFQETSDLAPDIKDALATAVRDDVDVDGWDAQIENAEWDSISVFADRASERKHIDRWATVRGEHPSTTVDEKNAQRVGLCDV